MLTNAGTPIDPTKRSRLEVMDQTEGMIEDLISKGSNLDYRGDLAPGKTLTVSKDQKEMTFTELMNLRRKNVKIKPIARLKGDLFPDGEDRWIFPDVVQEAFEAGYLCHDCWEWQESPLVDKCNPLYPTDLWKGCDTKPER